MTSLVRHCVRARRPPAIHAGAVGRCTRALPRSPPLACAGHVRAPSWSPTSPWLSVWDRGGPPLSITLRRMHTLSGGVDAGTAQVADDDGSVTDVAEATSSSSRKHSGPRSARRAARQSVDSLLRSGAVEDTEAGTAEHGAVGATHDVVDVPRVARAGARSSAAETRNPFSKFFDIEVFEHPDDSLPALAEYSEMATSLGYGDAEALTYVLAMLERRLGELTKIRTRRDKHFWLMGWTPETFDEARAAVAVMQRLRTERTVYRAVRDAVNVHVRRRGEVTEEMVGAYAWLMEFFGDGVSAGDLAFEFIGRSSRFEMRAVVNRVMRALEANADGYPLATMRAFFEDAAAHPDPSMVAACIGSYMTALCRTRDYEGCLNVYRYAKERKVRLPGRAIQVAIRASYWSGRPEFVDALADAAMLSDRPFWRRYHQKLNMSTYAHSRVSVEHLVNILYAMEETARRDSILWHNGNLVAVAQDGHYFAHVANLVLRAAPACRSDADREAILTVLRDFGIPPPAILWHELLNAAVREHWEDCKVELPSDLFASLVPVVDVVGRNDVDVVGRNDVDAGVTRAGRGKAVAAKPPKAVWGPRTVAPVAEEPLEATPPPVLFEDPEPPIEWADGIEDAREGLEKRVTSPLARDRVHAASTHILSLLAARGLEPDFEFVFQLFAYGVLSHSGLVAFVGGVDEPHRTTLLLRFFHSHAFGGSIQKVNLVGSLLEAFPDYVPQQAIVDRLLAIGQHDVGTQRAALRVLYLMAVKGVPLSHQNLVDMLNLCRSQKTVVAARLVYGKIAEHFRHTAETLALAVQCNSLARILRPFETTAPERLAFVSDIVLDLVRLEISPTARVFNALVEFLVVNRRVDCAVRMINRVRGVKDEAVWAKRVEDDTFAAVVDIACALPPPPGFPNAETFESMAVACATSEDRARLMQLMQENGVLPSGRLAYPLLCAGLYEFFVDPSARFVDGECVRRAEELADELVNKLGIPITEGDIERLATGRASSSRALPLTLLPIADVARVRLGNHTLGRVIFLLARRGHETEALATFEAVVRNKFGNYHGAASVILGGFRAAVAFRDRHLRKELRKRVLDAAMATKPNVRIVLSMYAQAAVEAKDPDAIAEVIELMRSLGIEVQRDVYEEYVSPAPSRVWKFDIQLQERFRMHREGQGLLRQALFGVEPEHYGDPNPPVDAWSVARDEEDN